ncbi:MAG: HIT domain-containing protein [Nitrospinota bacterium]
MKWLNAPWRLEYILGPKEDECIFCKMPKENNDLQNLIIHRGEYNFVILNLYPYNNGHLMVVPYSHTDNLVDLGADELGEMGTLTKICVEILTMKIKPEGFNIGMNIGTAAGAGIEEHLHMHIVPRWSGDTNFMPIVGNTKVLPQMVFETYDILLDGFNKLR